MKRTLFIGVLALFLCLGHSFVYAEDVPLSSLSEEEYQGITDYWGLDDLGSGFVNTLDNFKNKAVEYLIGVGTKTYNTAYNTIDETINKLEEWGVNIYDHIFYGDGKLYADSAIREHLGRAYNELFYHSEPGGPQDWQTIDSCSYKKTNGLIQIDVDGTSRDNVYCICWASSSSPGNYAFVYISKYPFRGAMNPGYWTSATSRSIDGKTFYVLTPQWSYNSTAKDIVGITPIGTFSSPSAISSTLKDEYYRKFVAEWSSGGAVWDGNAKPSGLVAPSINPRALYNYNYYTTNHYIIENEDNEPLIMDKLTADANKLFPDAKYEDFRVDYNGKENIKDISVNNGNFDFVLDTGNLDSTFVGEISVPMYIVTLATIFVVFLILGVVL